MKKLLGILLAVAILAGLGITAFAEDAVQGEGPALLSDVVVLFTSDVHSGVDQNWTYTGLDIIRNKLAADGNHVILVDDGDSIQGEPLATISGGAACIELMNSLGYEIAIPGNHEFDFGLDRFLELAEMADFPYISCNFNYRGDLVFEPYIIKEFDGVKIAFIGITTPYTLRTSTTRYFMDENGEFVYGFFHGDDDGGTLFEKIQEAADAARAEGAAYVVALCHLGNEEECRPYTYADIIANTTGIDALLDGHSHDTDQVVMKNKDGRDVLRSACGTKLESIGFLRISTDGKLSTGLYRWGSRDNAIKVLGLESPMNKAMQDATEELNKALAEVVAFSEVDLLINDPVTGVRLVRNQETGIGDLCSDAYRYAGGSDIAFVNGGGIRVPIMQGELTRSDILRLYPFGNMLCVCEATGQQILDALEYSASFWPGEFGGWLNPSGLTFEIHTYIPSSIVTDENMMFKAVAGERRVKNVLVGGEPIDPEKTYTVASHNHTLQNQGAGYTMFSHNVFTQDCTMLDTQVFTTYISEGLGGVIGGQYKEPQGRILFVDEPPAA